MGFNSELKGLITLLKPAGYVMHQQFNIQQLYVLPTLYLYFVFIWEQNSDLCHLQHKLTGFYNRDEKCLLHGTDWVFNPLKAELNPICHLLALLGVYHILHVSRIRVK